LRIADTKDYAEYICEFLGNIKCYSVVMTEAVAKSHFYLSFVSNERADCCKVTFPGDHLARS